jgi:hypothetical protein
VATIDRRPRPRETEAEAVAFIVSTAIGIRPSVDTTEYIQLYDGSADTLRYLNTHQSGQRTSYACCTRRLPRC